MAQRAQIFGEVNSKTDLEEVFQKIRKDVDEAGSREALTELYKRAAPSSAYTRDLFAGMYPGIHSRNWGARLDWWHNEKEDNPMPHQPGNHVCGLCGKAFNTHAALLEHERTAHTKDRAEREREEQREPRPER